MSNLLYDHFKNIIGEDNINNNKHVKITCKLTDGYCKTYAGERVRNVSAEIKKGGLLVKINEYKAVNYEDTSHKRIISFLEGNPINILRDNERNLLYMKAFNQIIDWIMLNVPRDKDRIWKHAYHCPIISADDNGEIYINSENNSSLKYYKDRIVYNSSVIANNYDYDFGTWGWYKRDYSNYITFNAIINLVDNWEHLKGEYMADINTINKVMNFEA